MGFRFRLALFVAATLVAVQLLTWALVYEVTRREVIDQGGRQLSTAADAFLRQLDDIAARVAGSVQVLSLDYPLRAAIAGRDEATVLSALRNHGRRVGAERMLLVGLDGRVEADTLEGEARTGSAFPFPRLLDTALERPATAVVAIDDRAYWMVVVPVYAPRPIALIAAGLPLDDALLARMQALSALPRHTELVAADGSGWTVLASGDPSTPLSAALLDGRDALPSDPVLVYAGGHEYVALARPLASMVGDTRISAVLGYSLDEALQPLRSVTPAWLLLLGLGLVAGVLGAAWVARGVARPVEALAEAARRIESGDYTPPPPSRRRDELAQLAASFTRMAEAIGEREQRIRFQAEHDAVSGLPNRSAAEVAVQRALVRAPRQPAALLAIGLARLPEVIKTMGHAIADGVVQEAAARLRLLDADRLIARAGDSQLMVWLSPATRADAIAHAFQVIDALGASYRQADLSIDAAPAVGIALAPDHGDLAGVLLRRADIALFSAQRSMQPMAVYDPAIDPHRPERLALMTELREALERGALELHYQPKLELASGRIDGVEALVRWNHPQRGPIPPDVFVVLAEETGNVQRLTRWVLGAGIAQAQRWIAAGRELRVSLNLSARDLDDTTLPRRVEQLLALHGVPASRIVLELTESAVMAEGDSVVQVLGQLAALGIDIAVDDFGVGQSSLAYLRRLPVRELKIDRSFIAGLDQDGPDENRENRTIVRSIVDLGHRLGYRVTSEGVESAPDLRYLVEIGCDHAQGWLIGRPMPASALDAFLDSHDPQAFAVPVASTGPDPEPVAILRPRPGRPTG